MTDKAAANLATARSEIYRILVQKLHWIEMTAEEALVEKGQDEVAALILSATEIAVTEGSRPFVSYRKFSPQYGNRVIDAARKGNPHAQRALNAVGITALHLHERLPASLSNYLATALLSEEKNAVRKGKAGRKPNYYRDDVIVAAVLRATELGLNATRNKAKAIKGGGHSACSLVAEVLTELQNAITEDAVEAIWKKYRKILNANFSDDQI